jgi:NADH pyrophosphatase NudC (nudix superfamily)
MKSNMTHLCLQIEVNWLYYHTDAGKGVLHLVIIGHTAVRCRRKQEKPMPAHLPATAAIIMKDNKIFIAKRSVHDKLSHKREFPGGKIEQSETPEECLERELLE